MWRRTKRTTVAHRWFWEAITTKASLSPYFRSVPALLVMLEFQGWSRDGSPSPWLATSLWSSLFTLSLLSLSLHCCFSSLRRLYVHIRIPTHNCVCCNICFDDIFFIIFLDIFTCWTSPKMFVFESQICYFFTDRLKRVTSSRVFASFSLFLETCGASNFSWPPLCVRDCCFSSFRFKLTFTNLKARCLSPSVWPTGSSCCSNCHLTAATALTLQIRERLFTSPSRGDISSLKGQMVSSP